MSDLLKSIARRLGQATRRVAGAHIGDSWLSPTGKLIRVEGKGGHVGWALDNVVPELASESREADNDQNADMIYRAMEKRGYLRLTRNGLPLSVDTFRLSRSHPFTRSQVAALERIGIENELPIQTDTFKPIYTPPSAI